MEAPTEAVPEVSKQTPDVPSLTLKYMVAWNSGLHLFKVFIGKAGENEYKIFKLLISTREVEAKAAAILAQKADAVEEFRIFPTSQSKYYFLDTEQNVLAIRDFFGEFDESHLTLSPMLKEV